MKTIEVKDRAEWRAWLARNHARETEIWVVYYKKGSGIPSIEYGDSVDEALCFGWVDSLIKAIDEQKYARKFTPRKDDSVWSVLNKQRVERLMREGLMTEHGLRKVEAAQRLGRWDAPVQRPNLDFEMPVEFSEALRDNPQAEKYFNNLTPSQQKVFIVWISTAKRPETRRKRIDESIQTLREGRELGLR